MDLKTVTAQSALCVERSRENPDRAGWDPRPWLIFGLLLSVYLFLQSGQFHAADEESILAMAESLVKHARFDTPQRVFGVQIELPITQETPGIDGHLYSKRGWTWPVVVAPFYALSLLSPHLGGLQVAHLASALVTALTGSLVYLSGRRLGFGSRSGFWAALAFGLGSIALVYARFLFSEPLIGLLLSGSVWALLHCRSDSSWRWPVLAGTLLGLAVATRLSTLTLLPVAGLYLLWRAWPRPGGQIQLTAGEPKDWRRLGTCMLSLGLGFLVPALLTAAYNAVRFGHFWQGGYTSTAEGFTTSLWTGLYGLLLSPGKGFFWFSPILLLALPGSVWLWRFKRVVLLLLWGLFGATAVTYALWYMWWGGSTWGPRFLVPLAGPLALLTLPAWEWAWRRPGRWVGVLLLLAASLVVQLLGAAVNFLHYGAFLAALDPRAEWTIAIHDLRYQPIWGHLQFLQPAHLDLAWIRPAGQRFVLDGWMLGVGLAVVVVVAVSCVSRRIQRQRWSGAALALALAGTAAFGQVRLQNALLARPETAPWQVLYGHLAVAARREDALFIQDSLGQQLAYSIDKSRVVRSHWSPQPWPLDEPTSAWVGRFAGPRVWFAAGVPGEVDPARGIERWLAERGARVAEVVTEQGPRLLLFEQTPRALTAVPAGLTWGGEVELIDYAHTSGTVHPGTTIHISLSWQTRISPRFDYSVFVHLVDPQGQIYRQVDGAPVSGFRPMSGWPVGETIVDRYGFLVPLDCPPGEYRLHLGVYRWDTLARLPIVNAGGLPMGDIFELGTVQVSAEP